MHRLATVHARDNQPGLGLGLGTLGLASYGMYYIERWDSIHPSIFISSPIDSSPIDYIFRPWKTENNAEKV